MVMRRRVLLQSALLPLLVGCGGIPVVSKAERIRVATFNVSLYDSDAGGLIRRLQQGDAQAQQAAAVIRHQRPDLLLLNEFDYDAQGTAADLFQRRYLEEPNGAGEAIQYPYRYFGPVNTGVASGLDINGDGQAEGPQDAWGFGTHPGQYGMLVLSRYPIDEAQIRSFQLFRWSQMPNARRPHWPDGRSYYPDDIWQALRLSSKSHWDVPIQTPIGTLHLLVSHPTPPVFDGPEDRNGTRNHDELRLWADYLDAEKGAYLVDDQGRRGAIADAAPVIVAGDLNADPFDGDASDGIRLLHASPRLNGSLTPISRGAALAAKTQKGGNRTQRGDPAADTGDFNDSGPGNLRVDHVIPSVELQVVDSGVFWPTPDEVGAEWLAGSDHRMVWVDLALRAER